MCSERTRADWSHAARKEREEEVQKGGEGGKGLAQAVVEAIEEGEQNFAPIYERTDAVKSKIETIAKRIYGADGVELMKKCPHW